MKVFASFRYQLADQKRGILTYYGVLLGFYVLFEILFVVAAVGEDVNGSTTNGITAVTAVYVFVASLCSFKDNFGMSLQNGVSRRSTFLARLCTAGAMCAVMAVADELVTILAPLPSRLMGIEMGSMSLMENLYFSAAGAWQAGAFLLHLCSAAFGFFMLLAAAGLGYLITTLFYRLNKLGKILVGAGVPVLVFFGLPALELLDQFISNGAVIKAVSGFFCRSVSICLWPAAEYGSHLSGFVCGHERAFLAAHAPCSGQVIFHQEGKPESKCCFPVFYWEHIKKSSVTSSF